MNKVNKVLSIVYLLASIAYFVFFFIFQNNGFPSWYSESKFDITLIITNLGVAVLIFILNLISKNLINNIISVAAFGMTLLADFCLVINNSYLLGVIFFIVAQLMYFLRMIFVNKYGPFRLIRTISARVGLIVIMIIVMFVTNMFSVLNLFVCIYFPLLIMNAFDSLISLILKRNKTFNAVSLVAFLLFIGCDVCVGLMNIGVPNVTGYLIWIFYIPSQIGLVLSTFILNIKK